MGIQEAADTLHGVKDLCKSGWDSLRSGSPYAPAMDDVGSLTQDSSTAQASSKL
jgi:hypothetical protein